MDDDTDLADLPDLGDCEDYDEYHDPQHLLMQIAGMVGSMPVEYLSDEDIAQLWDAFELIDQVWDRAFERRASDGKGNDNTTP